MFLSDGHADDLLPLQMGRQSTVHTISVPLTSPSIPLGPTFTVSFPQLEIGKCDFEWSTLPAAIQESDELEKVKTEESGVVFTLGSHEAPNVGAVYSRIYPHINVL